LSMLSVTPTSGLAADPADTHNLGWSFNSGSQAFDFLAVGESLTLTYTVQSTDNHAASDTQSVTIAITGTNDAPDIHVVTTGTPDSAAATLAETNAGLSTSGTLTVNDPDLSDTVSSTVTGVVLGGTTGGLASADVLSMLSVTPTSGLAADPADTHNLGWSFNSGSQAFDFLAVGESLTLTYTVQSTDNHAASDTQSVTITITGTNDAPDIHVVTTGTPDSAAATLAETNAGLSTSGTLTVNDPDLSDTVSSTVTGVVLGGTTGGLASADVLSMLSVTPTSGLAADPADTHNLGWSFNSGSQAFDFLAVGESLTLTYTVQSTDNHAASDTQSVTITITGTNDAPDIHVVTTGTPDSAAATLAETNAGLSTSGTLTVNDPDLSDTVSSTVTGVVLGGTTGGLASADVLSMLSVTPTSGLAADPADTHNLGWSFNSGSQAFDFLAVGESLTLTYTVQSTDNNAASDTQSVTITITGTNDAPDIHVVTTGTPDSAAATLAETNAGLSTSGTL